MLIDRRWLLDWHTWFAWYPVEVRGLEYVWLRRLKRRGIRTWFGWYWEYKET